MWHLIKVKLSFTFSEKKKKKDLSTSILHGILRVQATSILYPTKQAMDFSNLHEEEWTEYILALTLAMLNKLRCHAHI